jgi:hypothetical protein
MITALMVGGLVSCSEDEQTSSTTQEQTTVAVEDETTTTSTVDQDTSTTSLTATSTVTVTVTNVENAVGYDMAGVLYKGDDTLTANAVGGFGATVDADPFATTQVVRAPQYDPGVFPEDFDRNDDWPIVTDEPVMLEPGTYTLQLWLGEPPLCCYIDPFLPADSPSLSGCTTVFAVKEDDQVNITVNGIPSVDVPNNTSCATG